MNTKKRFAIYSFSDINGIVDKYVEYFLEALWENVDHIFIVCSCCVSNEDKRKLTKYGHVIIDENIDNYVDAYKIGINYIKEHVTFSCYELILTNDSVFGFVYPLSETLKKMEKNKKLDFWGITKCFKNEKKTLNKNNLYVSRFDYIETHFLVIRNKMLISDHFDKFLRKLSSIHSSDDAFYKFESIFTHEFETLGYKWDVSLNLDNLRHYTKQPLLFCPRLLCESLRCPIFKKTSFAYNPDYILSNTTGEQTLELYNFLDSETNFNVDMIWENILRNFNQYDIKNSLHLVYTLPTDVCKTKNTRFKVAVIYHVYFTDILFQTERYLQSIPEEYDVYITTDSENKKKTIEKALTRYSFNKCEIRLIENRGRDVSALLVGVKDIIMEYDLACFVHDKKTTQVCPETIGASFAYKCLENTLYNNNYIKNIVYTFESNRRLGLLCPPEPNHSILYPTIAMEWGANYEKTIELAHKLNFRIPISGEKPPIAPLGTMFWFRTAAMKPLYDKNWDYKDFPEEPNENDGTILHAIERLYSFTVQEAGFYPAICMNDQFCGIEYNNLRYYLRGFNRIMYMNGRGSSYKDLKEDLNNDYIRLNNNFVKKYFKLRKNFSSKRNFFKNIFKKNNILML